MEIRAYRESDLERIKEMHKRQNFPYPFPALSDPTFVVGAVAEEQGQAEMAVFLKVSAEVYMILDPDHGTPRDRWQGLLQIHEAVRRQAVDLGLESLQCWIPPELAKKTTTGREASFVRRLGSLGWTEDAWRSFCFRLR